MNRHALPAPSSEPDIAARSNEIRMPERSNAHQARNGREARA